ncbi:hypothetical protein NPIL_168601 [Nephila pilipes]|uniref:Uncharacterized protein n=1 Tax=Nephila pilipes TaxID=299642 RepID=A0A8X6J0X2_NEPPI|nr:hypothetical protein NPIL_168601 [Nephila pilipes]
MKTKSKIPEAAAFMILQESLRMSRKPRHTEIKTGRIPITSTRLKGTSEQPPLGYQRAQRVSEGHFLAISLDIDSRVEDGMRLKMSSISCYGYTAAVVITQGYILCWLLLHTCWLVATRLAGYYILAQRKRCM